MVLAVQSHSQDCHRETHTKKINEEKEEEKAKKKEKKNKIVTTNI